MDREGVEWVYREAVPLTHFDLEASRFNMGRLEGVPTEGKSRGIRESLAESYALAMLDGAHFPAVIAHERGGRYILISGNHRLRAAELAEVDAFDTYIALATDIAVIERLTRTANLALEGDRGTEEEGVRQAKFLVDVHHYAIKDAAAAVRLPLDRVERHLRAIKATDRLRGDLASRATGLPQTNLLALNTIENAPAFEAAVRLASRANLATATVQELAREVRARPDEKSQLRVVEEMAQRPDIKRRTAATRGGTARPRPEYSSEFFATAARLTNLLRLHPSLRHLGITDPAEITRAWDYRGKLLIALEGPFGSTPEIRRTQGPPAAATGEGRVGSVR